MRVKIGPYKNWIGPYQITDWFAKIFGQARIDKFQETKVFEKISDATMPFFQWIDKKKKRNIKIQIDDWDSWSADYTLALIIHPVLIQLRDSKSGSPSIDDEDVPEYLRRINDKTFDGLKDDTDAYWHLRWKWVLNEMIWAFEQIIQDDKWELIYHSPLYESILVDNDDKTELLLTSKLITDFDKEGYMSHHDRIQQGLILFGKYYRGLWT